MILIAAQLESFRSLKDRTLKLSFITNEPTPEDLQEIAKCSGQFGFLAFKDEAFNNEEIEIVETLKADFEETGKTESQRLRGVLYRLWEQKPEGYKIFADFYRAKMETLINHFKTKLD